MVHVIVGGGHFVERGGHLVQEFADHVRVGGRIAERIRGMPSVEKLLAASEAPSLISRVSVAPRPYTFREVQRQHNMIKLISNVESGAWDNFMNSHEVQGLKEVGLSAGCAAAGDIQGALEHGINAGVEAAQSFWDMMTGKALDDRGFQRDIGRWNTAADRP